jgi:hypothetical protein
LLQQLEGRLSPELVYGMVEMIMGLMIELPVGAGFIITITEAEITVLEEHVTNA